MRQVSRVSRIFAQKPAVLRQVLPHAIRVDQNGTTAFVEFPHRLTREGRLAGTGLAADEDRLRFSLLATAVNRLALHARIRALHHDIRKIVHDRLRSQARPRFNRRTRRP